MKPNGTLYRWQKSHTHSKGENGASKLAKYVKIGFNFTQEIHEPVKRDSHGSKACCVPKFPLSIRPKAFKHMEMIITSVHVKCKLATVIAIAFYFFCVFSYIFKCESVYMSCVSRFFRTKFTSLALLCRLGNIRYRRPLPRHTLMSYVYFIYIFRLFIFLQLNSSNCTFFSVFTC